MMTAVFPLFFVALATAAGLSGSAAALALRVRERDLGDPGRPDGPGDGRRSPTCARARSASSRRSSRSASPRRRRSTSPRAERWAFALAIFVIGNVAVTSSLAFYNALLPAVAQPHEIDRVSTAGFGLGYLGGGLLLAANLAMISAPERFGIPDAGTAVRLSFVSVAVWWALFSLPLLRSVKEPVARVEPGEDASRGPAARGARAARRDVPRAARTTRTPACCCSPSWSTTTPSTPSSRWA